MKIKLWCLPLVFAAAMFNAGPATAELSPLLQQSRAAHLSAEILRLHHYKHIPLDDALSAKIFDNYLKVLDSEKIFFLQTDIERFSSARTHLDEAMLNENLSIPFAIYNLYQQRVGERASYARSLLAGGFDFNGRESYQYVRKNMPWPKSADDMNELWRKRVKNDWLRLRLAGKDDASIRATLGKRYDNILSGMSKINSDDAFQGFMNAYATAIDPHTNYFGKRAAEEFDISMRLSLVGIGAVLQDKDEYTTIRELVAGGPAALSGNLNIGDRIVGVGQGENADPVDVMGWRLDDTVAIIRGAEDTVVRLDILPAGASPDGKHKLVSLLRKKISLDKQAANKSIIEIKDGGAVSRIGVITLPGFYLDFAARQNGDKEYKSATRDVARLLGELKKEKVDGVLIDLRNNGGGSLDEAVALTGLFIDKGPVVQQRDSNGNVLVSSDTNAGVVWNGALAVLINRASASASEIFAAAIQDYGRGIVVGERSFGKGTVQTVVNLDQLVKDDKAGFGELKMTIAQFFRINGGTTQLRGVTPDIALPTLTDAEEFGESSYDNALPWMQIKAADYKPVGDVNAVVPALLAKHDSRVRKDKDFQYLLEDIAELNARRKLKQLSLNEAERRKERASMDARVKRRDKDRTDNLTGNVRDDGLQSNERNIDADLAIEKARKDAKDILLNEAAHILSDEVQLPSANGKLVSGVAPRADIR